MPENMAETYFNSKDLRELASSRSVLTAALVLIVAVLVLYRRASRKKYKLPPGPTGVPILGYLPFLGPEPYKELDRLKEKYGNVFSIYMGMTHVVILGDFEAVKDAFSKPTTTDRPDRIFDILPDAVGFSSVNGEEWVEQRKFCVRSMREHGLGREKWESIIQVEVEDFIKQVSSFKGEPFEFNKILVSSVSNNISAFIFGKRFPFNHPDRVIIDQGLKDDSEYGQLSGLHNFFPIIRDISVALGIGGTARAHESMVKFNNFFREQVKKLKESYKDGEQENFIVDYLKEMDNHKGKTGHYFNETNLLGNIQALFIGGTDTTELSLTWLILILAKFPEIQSKIQQEVDSILGSDGQIRWSDRKKLPYTHATILEGQRWRTVAPLNTPRIAMEDIQIQNYDIPKGTTIIANNWGIHNDRRYWKEPEKFDPQRFLTEDGKEVITKQESYVPFSYGKRNCPADIIALMEILMYLTALVQKFTISVPKGEIVNLEGRLGLTYHAFPQELQFIQRNQNEPA